MGTLLRKVPTGSPPAVLYLHGWNDYFFQTHLAEFAELRLRLLRPGSPPLRPQPAQRPFRGFITDLDDYAAELDAAADLIGGEHDEPGADGSLDRWSDRRPVGRRSPRTGHRHCVLNSPWLDLQGSAMFRAIGTPVVDAARSAVTDLGDPAARPRVLRPDAALEPGRGVDLHNHRRSRGR